MVGDMLTSPRDRISSGGPMEGRDRDPRHPSVSRTSVSRSCDGGPERKSIRPSGDSGAVKSSWEEEEEEEEESGKNPREAPHRHPEDESVRSCKRKLALTPGGDAHVTVATLPESPPAAKRWVIGPLFQSFRSKMASFTEIVMSPVRLFTEGTGAPGDGDAAVTGGWAPGAGGAVQRLRFPSEGGENGVHEATGASRPPNSPGQQPRPGGLTVPVPEEVQDPVQDPVPVGVQVPVEVQVSVQVPVEVQVLVQVQASPSKTSESLRDAAVDRTLVAPRRRNAGNSRTPSRRRAARSSQVNGTALTPPGHPEGPAPARAACVKLRATRRRRKRTLGGATRPASPPEMEPRHPGARGGGASPEEPGVAMSLTSEVAGEAAAPPLPPENGGGVDGRASSPRAWRRRCPPLLPNRLKRSLSCPDISALRRGADQASAPPSPKRPRPPVRRERRHTVCSLEVEREIAPLCLRKEVYPGWARPPPGSLGALVSRFLSSPLAFLSERSGAWRGAGDSGRGFTSATPGFLPDAARAEDSAVPSHSSVFDPVPAPPGECAVPQESGVCETAPAQAQRRKVSSIRIRKTLPKPQYSLTPMGLPRALRVKKKVFSVEEIYTNKNFTKPPEGRLETIFEFPLSRRDGSESLFGPRRIKRLMDFPEAGAARKPRRPPPSGVGGAPRRGAWNSGRPRRGAWASAGEGAVLGQDSDSLLCSKLAELDTWMRRERAR